MTSPLAFLARRIVLALLLVVAASSAALLLTRLAPGDATVALGAFPKAEEVEAMQRQLQLDRNPLAQWADWAGRAVHLDFGESVLYGRPVGPLVVRAALNTAALALVALVTATVLGVALGIFTGSQFGGVASTIVHAASLVCISLPPLLTSLFLVFIAARTGWFPAGGMSSGQTSEAAWLPWLADVAAHLPLPVLALALPIAATFERMQSQSLREVLHQPFVTAGLARGLSRSQLILRHAWPVSLRPLCAVYGMIIGALLSGSFVVEYVTAWPGLGRLMYDALRARDIYLVAGCAAMGSLFLAIGTLAGDLLLAITDPRDSRGHDDVKRAGEALLFIIVVVAVLAPWLAPLAAERRFPDLLYAPPTPVHIIGSEGVRTPFIYARRVVSRLQRTFADDRSREVPLRWMTRDSLVSADPDGGAPLLLLGTDGYGRDVFSRLILGSRVTLGLAAVAALAAVLVGTLIGGLAGYAGGLADDLLSRLSEFVLVLPTIYVVLALRGVMPLVLPASAVFALLVGIFAMLGWPVVARGVRAIVASERQREYAMAARAAGVPPARLLFVHLLPAAKGHVAVQTTLLIPAFILAEATMSYVGLGFPPTVPTWGTMLQDAANVATLGDAPWALAPAAAIFVVVLAVNLVVQGSTSQARDVPGSTARAPVQLGR